MFDTRSSVTHTSNGKDGMEFLVTETSRLSIISYSIQLHWNGEGGRSVDYYSPALVP